MTIEQSFQTTIWTSIRLAKSGQPDGLEYFLRKYREPVVSFIRRRGHSPEDAEDLAQEVFMLVLREGLLARAEQSRGRFRSFLLGVVKNVLRNAGRIRGAAKRGGGRDALSLDALVGDVGDLLQAPERDEEFDRAWMQQLVRLALARLRTSHPRCHEAMEMHLDAHLTYSEIGQRLGLQPKQVDNLLQQARRRLGDLVREEIAATCSSGEEFDSEIAYLTRFLQ